MPDDLTPFERRLLELNARGWTQQKCATELKCGDRKVRRLLDSLKARGYPVVSRQAVPNGRPQQVARMLNAGMTFVDIAAELCLGVGTVKDYRDKAKKLGLELPATAVRGDDTKTLDQMRRELQVRWAKDVVFEGNVFEDVRLKNHDRGRTPLSEASPRLESLRGDSKDRGGLHRAPDRSAARRASKEALE